MKAYLNGELVVSGPIASHVTGYKCDRIELDASDARMLARWAQRSDGYAYLAQLSGRFVENRLEGQTVRMFRGLDPEVKERLMREVNAAVWDAFENNELGGDVHRFMADTLRERMASDPELGGRMKYDDSNWRE